MNQCTEKTVVVSRGFTYKYWTSPPKGSLPTVLLIHGWPDCADLWSQVIGDYLLPKGYGVLAPDCLGYGGSSKPLEPEVYASDVIAQDFVELLDLEGLGQVVALGHDAGSIQAQRLYGHFPDRVSGLVLVNVAYYPPSERPFNLDEFISISEQQNGYSTWHYWRFYTSPEAPSIFEEKIDSFFTVLHGQPETWLDTWCTPNGIKDFLLADKRQPVMAYATDDLKDEFIARMRHDKFTAPMNWYKAFTMGFEDGANQKILQNDNLVIKVPIFYFGATKDMVCRPELLDYARTAGLVPHCEQVLVDTGHWSMLSEPQKFGDAVTAWLQRTFV